MIISILLIWEYITVFSSLKKKKYRMFLNRYIFNKNKEIKKCACRKKVLNLKIKGEKIS